jgi:hypothetical protein
MDSAVAERIRLAAEQELRWKEELLQSRLRLIARVEKAISLTSPTRRRALYEEWRKELGDLGAREQAKFAEACIAGTVSIKSIKKMVGQ